MGADNTSEMDDLTDRISEISRQIQRATLILRTPQYDDTLETLQQKIEAIQLEQENNKRKLEEAHPIFKYTDMLLILTNKEVPDLRDLTSEQVIGFMNTFIKEYNKESPDQMDLIQGRFKPGNVYSDLCTAKNLMAYHDRLTEKYSEMKEHSESESMDATNKRSSLSP